MRVWFFRTRELGRAAVALACVVFAARLLDRTTDDLRVVVAPSTCPESRRR